MYLSCLILIQQITFILSKNLYFTISRCYYKIVKLFKILFSFMFFFYSLNKFCVKPQYTHIYKLQQSHEKCSTYNLHISVMSNSQIFSVIGHDIVLMACVLLVFTVIEPALKKLLVHYRRPVILHLTIANKL